MKAELVVYKILSFLLLPVAALLGINCLATLIIALANPVLLLPLFLLVCLVIYIIASHLFLTRGIERNSRRKPALRDWIRLNGFITLIFCLFGIPRFLGVKMQPADAKAIMEQLQAQNGLQLGVSNAEFLSIMNSFMTAMAILCLILLVHIIITFHLMRRYKYLFSDEDINVNP